MQASEAYNVFQRKRQPALRCAIRQGRPVPVFIQGETWNFGGTIRPNETVPGDFQPDAAAEATRLVGYYLFHALRS